MKKESLVILAALVISAFSMLIPESIAQNPVAVGLSIRDTTAPIINLITPINNSGTNNINMTIYYNVSDAGAVSNCSLIFDNSINFTSNNITKDLRISFNLSGINLGRHAWSINCTDSNDRIGESSSRIFYANNLGNFNGSTNNLSNSDATNIGTLTLDMPPYGKMVFNNVNLSQGYDFDSYVDISNNRAGLQPENILVLNKTSTISLYNLGFLNPRILRNNEICQSPICVISSYSGGTLVFSVAGFSNYSAQETPVEQTSSVPSGGGGGSGGGIAESKTIVKEIDNFEIDRNTLKTSIKQGQARRELIKVTNTGNTVLKISVNLSGIDKFKSYPESSSLSFTLNPQENYEIELNLKATELDASDLYPSKIIFTAKNLRKILPVIIEIESADPLFDADVEILPQSKNAIAGEEVFFEVNLFNVRSAGRVDVLVNYIIKNLEGDTVAAEQETLAVETKASFTRSVLLPSDIEPGTYVAFVKITYGNQTALSSDVLEVSAKEIRLHPTKFSDTKLIITISLFALIFAGLIFSYWNSALKGKSPSQMSDKSIIGKDKNDKLAKEIKSLDNAHKSGFISDESFEKEKARLEAKTFKK